MTSPGNSFRPPNYESRAYDKNLALQELSEYNLIADELVQKHHERFAVATNEYYFDLQNVDPADSLKVRVITSLISSDVYSATTPIVGEARKYVDFASDRFPNLLSSYDLDVLQQASVQARVNGVTSPLVETVINTASDETSRLVIKAALDKYVLDAVQQAVYKYGVQSNKIGRVLMHASSESVRAVMKASLDNNVFNRLNTEAIVGDLNSRTVIDSLLLASSTTVRFAFKTSLDKHALMKAMYTNDPTTRKKILESATDQGRSVFEKMFPYLETQATQDNKDDTRKNSYFGKDPLLSGSKSTKSESETIPRKDPIVEIKEMVKIVTTNHRQFAWLSSTDPRDILRVVNTVNRLRQKAEDKGEVFTDRMAYLKYKQASETDPKFTSSLQIIEALMGGNWRNGKLPF